MPRGFFFSFSQKILEKNNFTQVDKNILTQRN